MDEIVKDFLIESHENLDRLDQELVKLESDPGSKELIASIFRTIHTIKGSCGFLGFAHLEKVAHRGENLLSKLREGLIALDADITSGLLAMVDAVRRMLDEIQATERDGDNDYPELVERLEKLQASGNCEISTIAVKPPTLPESGIRIVEDVPPPPPLPPPAPTAVIAHSQDDSATSVSETVKGSPQFRPAGGKIGGLLVDRGCIVQDDLAIALQEQERGDRRRLGEILVALGFVSKRKSTLPFKHWIRAGAPALKPYE